MKQIIVPAQPELKIPEPNPITKFFAGLYDKFKLKSPVVAAIIATALGLLSNYLSTHDFTWLSGDLKDIVNYVLLFILGITGARTSAVIAATSKEAKN